MVESYNVAKVQMAPMAAKVAATPGSTVRLPCTQPSALRPAITWEKVPANPISVWPNMAPRVDPRVYPISVWPNMAPRVYPRILGRDGHG